MTAQLIDEPCPCFGQELRRLRDRADMSLGKLAELTGSTVEMVDEVERGRRAVSTAWVQLADEVLDADGMLCAEAGECVSYHAGMLTDIRKEFSHKGTGPVRLPAAFTTTAA
jgi:transcriptional regulator with XRE-family HTH domain